MILSGVFERYPNLRVGVAEHELNWVPYWIERMNYSYNERAAGREGFQTEERNGAQRRVSTPTAS